MITKEEVISAQNSWSEGLLEIVNSHLNNNDYISCASKFINGNNLKKGFGWFVMVMALIILFKEII